MFICSLYDRSLPVLNFSFKYSHFEAEHLYLQHIDTCQHFWSKHQQQPTILSVHHNHVTIKIISILQIKIKTTTVNFDCSKANTETWEFHMPFVLCPRNLEMEKWRVLYIYTQLCHPLEWSQKRQAHQWSQLQKQIPLRQGMFLSPPVYHYWR